MKTAEEFKSDQDFEHIPYEIINGHNCITPCPHRKGVAVGSSSCRYACAFFKFNSFDQRKTQSFVVCSYKYAHKTLPNARKRLYKER